MSTEENIKINGFRSEDLGVTYIIDDVTKLETVLEKLNHD